MEDSESLSDLELDAPPKLTFDELKTQVLKDSKSLRSRPDLLKTLYYYCKDCKLIITIVVSEYQFIFCSKEAFKNH